MPAGIGFFRADYETQLIYTAFDAKWVESDDVSRSVFSAAAGIAPYKAEFDQLNTWLILQLEHVTGMVCSFCAQGILAHFKKHPAISEVHVVLTGKIVLLEERKGKSITDKEIGEQIKKSGFDLVKVERLKEDFETAKGG